MLFCEVSLLRQFLECILNILETLAFELVNRVEISVKVRKLHLIYFIYRHYEVMTDFKENLMTSV